MKNLSLLLASLFIAAAAVAQSSEKPKSAAPNFPPIADIHAHVCGIHFYNGDMSRQVIAEHYCAHLSDEVLECVLYDSDKPGARLIGIEYIVSAKIFESLPAEEKKLWHSHNYEVRRAHGAGNGRRGGERSHEGADRDLRKNLAHLAS